MLFLRNDKDLQYVPNFPGVSLSSLLGAWHNDTIINILNDAMEKITMSATCCPSVATPTHWHRERLRWKVRLHPWQLNSTSCWPDKLSLRMGVCIFSRDRSSSLSPCLSFLSQKSRGSWWQLIPVLSACLINCFFHENPSGIRADFTGHVAHCVNVFLSYIRGCAQVPNAKMRIRMPLLRPTKNRVRLARQHRTKCWLLWTW